MAEKVKATVPVATAAPVDIAATTAETAITIPSSISFLCVYTPAKREGYQKACAS